MSELLASFVEAGPNQARLVRLPASARTTLDGALSDPGVFGRASRDEAALLRVGDRARRGAAVQAAQLYACLEVLWFLAWESEEGDRILASFEVVPL